MNSLLALDSGILLYIQDYVREPFMNPFWIYITSLGDGGIFWITLSLLLMIPKRTREIGAAALVSMALCALCTNIILKPLIARIRPSEVIEGLTTLIPDPTESSFPSGHTTASFACALVLIQTLPRGYGVPALILAALVGFSRLYVGVHYPSDVLGGIAVALAGSTLVLIMRKKMRERREAVRLEGAEGGE